MAEKKIQIVLELKNGQYIASIKEASEHTDKFRKRVEGAAGGIGAGFQKLYNMAKMYIGYQVAKYFVDLAGTFDDVKTSFNSLTSGVKGGSEALLQSIKTAAKGTVAEIDIMKSSNLALTLMGEQVADYLPKMMEIARSTAATRGIAVSQMYEDIIVASGRRSVMILDNLGISSVTAGKYQEEFAKKLGKTREQLNETQKSQAFFYAVMKGGGEIIEKTGTETLTFGQRVQMVKAKATDAATTFAQKLIPGLEALSKTFTDTNAQGGSLIGTIGKWISNIFVFIATLIEKMKMIPGEFAQIKRNIADLASGNQLLQYRNKIEEYWAKADPKDAIKYIEKYKKSLMKAGFTEEYLEGRMKVFVSQSKYSWNQGEMKQDAPKGGGSKKSAAAEADEQLKKKREEAKKWLDEYRQIGMTETQIMDDNRNNELKKLEDLHAKKLISEEEYNQTKAKINKKYNDQINDYYFQKTQQWLNFGSQAIGEIGNLYNMAADNKIKKLDEEYAAQVEAIENSTLSEEEKENKLAILEADIEAKKKKVQLENAKKQKKISLLQAMVDVPAAVMATFRNMGGWPWGVIPAAIMAGIGAKKIQMIKDQPVALAEGGIATAASMAMIGEGKYNEAVLPLSAKTYSQIAEGIERNRQNSSQVVNHIDNRVIVQGSILDKDGFSKAVTEANRNIERRTGVSVYSRKSVYQRG